jgi:hypothetical protein
MPSGCCPCQSFERALLRAPQSLVTRSAKNADFRRSKNHFPCRCDRAMTVEDGWGAEARPKKEILREYSQPSGGGRIGQ